jgi:hypothetical protein
MSEEPRVTVTVDLEQFWRVKLSVTREQSRDRVAMNKLIAVAIAAGDCETEGPRVTNAMYVDLNIQR